MKKKLSVTQIVRRAKVSKIVKALSVGLLQVLIFFLVFYGTLTLELALLYTLDFSYLANYANFSMILSISGLFLLTLGFPIYLGVMF